MTGYWIRHRAIFSIILSIAIGLIAGFLFVFPIISRSADTYNSQSIYKNSIMDFIAPEPSFEQIKELPNTNGIDRIFPFFYTKTTVTIGNTTRTTAVLLSDDFQNVDITMYNSNRLIKESGNKYDNAVWVDWRFAKDTSTDVDDTISVSLGDISIEYKIAAIYETNTVYENGAILARITPEQKDSIVQKSKSNGYSGMYVSASDYNTCKSFLTIDYRPLGRLRNREQFDSDDQYKVHYDAIMSSGYANEITDFRIKESSLEKENNTVMIWIGTALSAVLIIVSNILLSKRSSEKGYFIKHCIPKGQNVKPYYTKTFICELLCFAAAYAAVLIFKIKSSSDYIPSSAISIEIAFVPVAVLVSEIICLIMNNSMLRGISKKRKST